MLFATPSLDLVACIISTGTLQLKPLIGWPNSERNSERHLDLERHQPNLTSDMVSRRWEVKIGLVNRGMFGKEKNRTFHKAWMNVLKACPMSAITHYRY